MTIGKNLYYEIVFTAYFLFSPDSIMLQQAKHGICPIYFNKR